ncbi:MAG: SGNH/GDSL hydrolase family protein [Ruminococcus sp.]|nr:SGNH/GDSL hydrolase family protein [Ruminococcus sp.]
MSEFAVKGNNHRFKEKLSIAAEGGSLTVAFLGGSITMGCHATEIEKRYTNRCVSHLEEKYPAARFTLVNGGIGATTSQFGAARLEDDILRFSPDIVFLEFSVNDDGSNEMFKETYESCLRRLLTSPTAPAVMVINNLFYDNGDNAQGIHNEAAAYYGVPAVSVRDYDWPRLQSGELKRDDLTGDGLHPNDKGMEIIAMLVNNAIDAIADEQDDGEFDYPDKPLTKARYDTAKRFDNRNTTPEYEGFIKDEAKQSDITDIFKNGWYSEKAGARICFSLECSVICIQWRRTIRRPAPIAKAIIDGDTENAITLDANFDEDWGDLLCLTTLFESDSASHHTLEIVVDEQPDNDIPFYITSVITAG